MNERELKRKWKKKGGKVWGEGGGSIGRKWKKMERKKI